MGPNNYLDSPPKENLLLFKWIANKPFNSSYKYFNLDTLTFHNETRGNWKMGTGTLRLLYFLRRRCSLKISFALALSLTALKRCCCCKTLAVLLWSTCCTGVCAVQVQIFGNFGIQSWTCSSFQLLNNPYKALINHLRYLWSGANEIPSAIYPKICRAYHPLSLPLEYATCVSSSDKSIQNGGCLCKCPGCVIVTSLQLC